MAPARLNISEHARERLKQRQITRQQVRLCLYAGELITFDLNGRKVFKKKIRNKLLVVVALEVLGGHIIITAYWEDL